MPDAQSSVDDVHGVAAFAYGLIHWLAARFDAGEPLPVADDWRIDENRWAAMRDGVEGTLADLVTGERVSTRELLSRAPGRAARRARPRARPRADRGQRRHPHPGGRRGRGVRGVAEWLVGRF